MKVYKKPTAEIELFKLDSEFAGGCSVTEQDVYAEFQQTFEDFSDLDNEYDEFVLKKIYKFNFGEFGSYEEMLAAKAANAVEYISALDNWVMDRVKNGADNLTSGFCYFTYASALMKSFS